MVPENWSKYFEYFEWDWMIVIEPEYFIVFQSADRTNNYIESYHRGIKNKIGGRKPPIEFLRKFLIGR